MQPGQRVPVPAAAGGVGHFTVQLVKHVGAQVLGTASVRHHDWLSRLGADELVDYRALRFEDHVRDVDVVVDLVGDASDRTGTRSIEVLCPNGLLGDVVTVEDFLPQRLNHHSPAPQGHSPAGTPG